MHALREIHTDEIRQLVYTLALQACREFSPDVQAALQSAYEHELCPQSQSTLALLIENQRLAAQKGLPLCQDTGMAVLFLDIGQDVHICGEPLHEALHSAVRDAYRDGYFRPSIVSPVERMNTGDNTPAIIHTQIVPGNQIHITVAPKGFGSENMSSIAMLKPSQGREGILNFIVDTVQNAGGNPCPPVIVGVGIGGDFELCALMAKKALLRPLDAPAASIELQAMQEELMMRINALGIGAMGLGGTITALGVQILSMPTHIAGMPVAVNMQCHCARHAQGVL